MNAVSVAVCSEGSCLPMDHSMGIKDGYAQPRWNAEAFMLVYNLRVLFGAMLETQIGSTSFTLLNVFSELYLRK